MESRPQGGFYAGSSMNEAKTGTALHLVNNGTHVNERNNPHIFRNQPQVLKLPSRAAAAAASTPVPSSYEKLFGQGHQQPKETTSHELSRHEILTVRQLQRALQSKIRGVPPRGCVRVTQRPRCASVPRNAPPSS